MAARGLALLRELDLVNQATLLGAGLLASLLPFMILLGALANQRVDDDIARRLGLNERGALILTQLFGASHPAFSLAMVISLLVALAGTLAVGSSLQQIYEKLFAAPPRGLRAAPRLLVWVAVLCAAVSLQSVIGRPIRNASGGRGLIDVVTFALFTLFFWWTMRFLLFGAISWRRLFPSALCTGFLFAVVGVFSELYFSSSLITDAEIYGAIGAVFTILTWLIAISAAIIVGPVIGFVWSDRPR